MQKRDTLSETLMVEMMYERGMRPSLQRVAVLAHVANLRKHPTADEIYTDLAVQHPSLSKTTVYNSLHALVEAGLLRELEIESGNCRYDLAPQPPHSHFVCRKCGRIFDMCMPAGVNEMADPGFAVDSVDVCYRGVCPECKSSTNK